MLRLDFIEFPKNRQYQFRILKNDELDMVEAEFDKLLSKQIICKSKRERMFSPGIRRMGENA